MTALSVNIPYSVTGHDLADLRRKPQSVPDFLVKGALKFSDLGERGDCRVYTVKGDNHHTVTVGNDHVTCLDPLVADLDWQPHFAGAIPEGRVWRQSGAPHGQAGSNDSGVVPYRSVSHESGRTTVFEHCRDAVTGCGAPLMAVKRRDHDISVFGQFQSRKQCQNVRWSAVDGESRADSAAIYIVPIANGADIVRESATAKHGVNDKTGGYAMKGIDLPLGRASHCALDGQ